VSRNTQTVAVRILDKEYQVACPPEQQAELLMSAKHLDEQMRAIRETGKVIGLERIAVMAALNISHELLRARNGAADSGDADPSPAPVPGSLDTLNNKLDQALQQLRQIEIG
jgi:cell division protein ZapA